MQENLRNRMTRVYDLLYDRQLTNIAGGNMTLRAGTDRVYITRSGGTKWQLGRMGLDDIITADFDGTILDGEGPLSREYLAHTSLMKEFPSVGAVIHGHPLYATIFAARMEPIPVFVDHMKKFGPIPIVSDTHPVCTPGFIADMIPLFAARRDALDRYGYGVLYPRHGLTVAAPTVEDALDLMERIEWNAAAIAFSRAMGGPADGNRQ